MPRSSSGTTMAPMTPEERERYEAAHAVHVERQKLMRVPEEDWPSTSRLGPATTTVSVRD